MSKGIELLESQGSFEEGRWTFSISARCLTPGGVDVLINILGVMRSVMTDEAPIEAAEEVLAEH